MDYSNDNNAIMEVLQEAECVLYYAKSGNPNEEQIQVMHDIIKGMVKVWADIMAGKTPEKTEPETIINELLDPIEY